jgi:hypothetical protein
MQKLCKSYAKAKQKRSKSEAKAKQKRSKSYAKAKQKRSKSYAKGINFHTYGTYVFVWSKTPYVQTIM